MTPTSDERREAAGRMREEAAEFRRLGEEYDHVWTVDLGDAPAEFQDVAHFAGLDGVVREDELFDRMADLMDPTCEMDDAGDVPDSVKDNLNTFFCSECGSPIYNDMSPSYCPYCGARVVSER